MTEKIKVIICDDHILFRTGVKNSLAKYEDIGIVGEAENGLQLIKLLKTLRPDIIILNISMPVMDGQETLPILKKEYPHIKVIILSMHNDKSVICKMIELGANGYLTKEAGSGEIYEAVKACYEKWFYINRLVVEAMGNNLDPDTPVNLGKKIITQKEQDILYLVMQEKEIKEIADLVGLHPRTVEAIINRLKTRFHVKTRAGLIMATLKVGAIPSQ